VLLTSKEVEKMPAGEALNNLIQEYVFKAVPLTDDEFALVRAVWMRSGPQWAQQSRPFKVPMSRVQIEGVKASHVGPYTTDPEIVPCYSLEQAQDYSGHDWGARNVVATMRNGGWLYEFAEMDGGKIKSVRFKRLMWKSGITPVEIIGHSFGGTDELAVCRAALLAMMLLEEANEGGWKTE
jgi:hypothetical protein